jgi:hydrogenase small subunit
MPFMDEPPGGKLSSTVSSAYGTIVRTLRNFTIATVDKEPSWRHKGKKLTTGYTKH